MSSFLTGMVVEVVILMALGQLALAFPWRPEPKPMSKKPGDVIQVFVTHMVFAVALVAAAVMIMRGRS